MIMPDLFEFAYVPDWFGQLNELKDMALPESWKFKKQTIETKNQDTPILERYINTIFRKQAIDYNSEQDKLKAQKYFRRERYHCYSIEGADFEGEKYFDMDVVDVIFAPGEIPQIAIECMKLAGYMGGVEAVKN